MFCWCWSSAEYRAVHDGGECGWICVETGFVRCERGVECGDVQRREQRECGFDAGWRGRWDEQVCMVDVEVV